MAILGGYSFLIGIFKIKGAISKKPPTKEIAAAPATASSDGSAMPSSDSRKFLFVSIVKKNKKWSFSKISNNQNFLYDCFLLLLRMSFNVAAEFGEWLGSAACMKMIEAA